MKDPAIYDVGTHKELEELLAREYEVSAADLNCIYREGWDARAQGVRKNPYPVSTMPSQYESWLRGWEDMDEHLAFRGETWLRTRLGDEWPP